jgi:hypothetical protein
MTQPTRLDVPADFSRASVALIRLMEEDGWTGRMSANHHAIMRAPDGTATCSIGRKPRQGRGQANNEAPYKRWKAAQADIRPAITVEDLMADEPVSEPVQALPAPVDTAPEAPVAEVGTEPRWNCDECGRDFQSLQYLNVHKVRAHVRVSCPVCDREFSPGNLPRHKRTHEAEFSSPDQMLREIYQLREEVASWSALAEDAEDRFATLQAKVRAALDY